MAINGNDLRFQLYNRPTIEGGQVSNSLSIDDYYDPKVAQQQTSDPITGIAGTDCYGLRTEPFNECANFLQILQSDQRIVSSYNLLLSLLRDPELRIQTGIAQGLVAAIHTEANIASLAADKFIDSVISQVRGQSYWTDPQGVVYGPTEPLYYDPAIDRQGWKFTLDYDKNFEGESLILYGVKTGLGYLNNFNAYYKIGFDFTGEVYRDTFTWQEDRTFNILIEARTLNPSNTEYVEYPREWDTTVAYYGPDAVRRGKITEDDDNYKPDASFYNLCLYARGKLADYKDRYPEEYELDLANLTDEQRELLSQPLLNTDSQITLSYASLAEYNLYNAFATATDPQFYSSQPQQGLINSVLSGLLNSEALYRVAIAIQALRNILVICQESVKGFDLSVSYWEKQRTIQQEQGKYAATLAKEEKRRRAREAALAERFDPNSCRIVDTPAPNPCNDKANPTTTFLENWTIRDRTSPFYSIDKKTYYLVYDKVIEDFSDFNANRDSYLNTYGTEVYKILNQKYSLNLPDPSSIDLVIGGILEEVTGSSQQVTVRTFSNSTTSQGTLVDIPRTSGGQAPFELIAPEPVILEPVVRTTEDGIYFEPRAFKPSKILFRLENKTISAIRQEELALRPRYAVQDPEFPYIKTYYFSIKDFFDYLEGFENILKKYVFDHTLWKITFGNENPDVTNMSVVANPFFKNIKTGILKQDSKDFQKFRTLFMKLLSKNGIMLSNDRRLMKTSQTYSNDRISLVFTFDIPDQEQTANGTTSVSPPPINSLTKPPTNNAGSGVPSGIIVGKNIRLHRVQILDSSRPPVDMIWKNEDGSGGNLSGLNSQDVFRQETAMNYLLNLETLLNLIRPNKKERI